jgi:hypothetical protein
MPRLHLHRFDDVVDVIGGVEAVANLVGESHSAVSEWRKRTGLFPARHFFLISRELREWECDAPDDLFEFTGHRLRPVRTARARWSEERRRKILDGKLK